MFGISKQRLTYMDQLIDASAKILNALRKQDEEYHYQLRTHLHVLHDDLTKIKNNLEKLFAYPIWEAGTPKFDDLMGANEKKVELTIGLLRELQEDIHGYQDHLNENQVRILLSLVHRAYAILSNIHKQDVDLERDLQRVRQVLAQYRNGNIGDYGNEVAGAFRKAA